MKQKILIAGILSVVLGGFFVGATAFAEDEELTCSVLPQSICKNAEQGGTDSGIWRLIIWVLNIMIALVGLAATGSVIYAGVLYSSAGGNSENIAKAKTIIVNTAIGIVAFGLMYVALNWLVPGGIFN